jgi:hypothetical protein
VKTADIEKMPRGGPDASWLDPRLQTNCPEYLDRDDVDERVKRSVVKALDWTGEFFKNHAYFGLSRRGRPIGPQVVVASRSKAT